MRKKLALGAIGLGAAGLGAVAAFELRIHPMWRSWGIDPDEAIRVLPGDDIVGEPSVTDTRGITIDAPPEAVWPWLVQMGYGRAGWYSYDALDMLGKSTRSIVPAWQSVAVGDMFPTDPEGGFHVKVVEPGHALVLYVDTHDVEARPTRRGRHARRARRGDEPAVESPAESVPVGLAFSGGLLGATTPAQFAASWTFVLDPLEGGRTRLIERYRVWFGETVPVNHVAAPALGLGVFIMTRRQMLGIRDRAEEHVRAERPLAAAATATEPSVEPIPVDGPMPG